MDGIGRRHPHTTSRIVLGDVEAEGPALQRAVLVHVRATIGHLRDEKPSRPRRRVDRDHRHPGRGDRRNHRCADHRHLTAVCETTWRRTAAMHRRRRRPDNDARRPGKQPGFGLGDQLMDLLLRSRLGIGPRTCTDGQPGHAATRPEPAQDGTGDACGFTETRSRLVSSWNQSATIMSTIDAEEAWCPPTSGSRRRPGSRWPCRRSGRSGPGRRPGSSRWGRYGAWRR